MYRKIKIIIPVIFLLLFLNTLVFAAIQLNVPYYGNNALQPSNVCGFDINFALEHPDLLYRFGFSTLASDDIASLFAITSTDSISGGAGKNQQIYIGTKEYNQLVSSYARTHYVGCDGDSYWLGDSDTVDYRGNIVHKVDTSLVYGDEFKAILNDIINSGNLNNPRDDDASIKDFTHPIFSYKGSDNTFLYQYYLHLQFYLH